MAARVASALLPEVSNALRHFMTMGKSDASRFAKLAGLRRRIELARKTAVEQCNDIFDGDSAQVGSERWLRKNLNL